MSAILENSAVATGLEKVSFHSSFKAGQCQRMFKLSYNCTHLTCQQGNAQNPSSQTSAVNETRISRCISWVYKKAEEPEIKLPTFIGSWRKQENSRKNIHFCFIDYAKAFSVWIRTNWKILRDGSTRPPYLSFEKPVCRSRSNIQNQTWNN